MTNKVSEIFTTMSDQELSQAIREMKEDNPKGIIRLDGIVRNKCRLVSDVTSTSPFENLMMVQFAILQEAAHRFTPNID